MGATTERWLKLESLFEQAVALAPAERRRFVDQHCGSDDDLRRRLRDMLASDDDAGVLDHGALPASGIATVVDAGLSLVGRRIGDFHVLRVIAAGGMGTVYEAQQQHPPRRVALKVLSAALASPDALRRFEFEAQTLARLQHPAIAAIYESGVLTDDAAGAVGSGGAGRPFFAMELVQGQPLTQFAHECGPDLRQLVELLIKVCEGVEHAHSRGVIHRDLKPANIMVIDDPRLTIDDSASAAPATKKSSIVNHQSSMPKILDFGIARAVDAHQRATISASRTTAGQILGTLAYMSPEQIAGDAGRIDIRSDVYSLGVIAYELLGGRTPHDLTTASLAQAARLIAEREPQPLGSLSRICRGDLETIVAKALEKEPDRRYLSASHLADDLRRWQSHEPIAARRASRLYQLKKFARRNRVFVGGVCAVFAALALGVIATTWQWRQTAAQRDSAEAARTRAEKAEKLAKQRLQEALRDASAMLDIADTELAGMPGGSRPRESMALAALERLQRAEAQVAAEGTVDPGMRQLLGYAHQRVGEAQLARGHSALALANQQRALDLRIVLAGEKADVVDYPRTLAVGHWKIAEPLLVMGRVGEATAHHREALRVLEAIALRGEDSLINRVVYVGLAWRRLGESELLAGRVPESIDAFERAFALFDQALDIEPDQMTVLRTRSTALRVYGEALIASGDAGRAIEAYQESLRQAEALLATVGNANVFESVAAARAHALLSVTLAGRGERDQAHEHIAAAQAHADRLAAADPANFDAMYLQAWCWMHAAEVAQGSGEAPDSVRQSFERAAQALLPLAELDPDNGRVRVDALHCCEALEALVPAADANVWRARAAALQDHPGVRELMSEPRD